MISAAKKTMGTDNPMSVRKRVRHNNFSPIRKPFAGHSHAAEKAEAKNLREVISCNR